MTTTTLQIAYFKSARGDRGRLEGPERLRENRRQAEEVPQLPPRTLLRSKLDLRAPMTMGEFHVWTARTPETGELVGEISTSIRSTGSNEHVAWFDVFGLPEFRRLGVGACS